jgi:hypothetical protein
MVPQQDRTPLLKIAVVTTSWPSENVPWAGHFLKDLTLTLDATGHQLSVATVSYREDGGLVRPIDIPVQDCLVGRARTSLRGAWTRWPKVAAGLRRAVILCARSEPDLWMAHWWPSLLVVPSGTPAMCVLHGSDVDLLESLPRSVARWVNHRALVVAVAPGLAERFAQLAGCPLPRVCLLGAHRARSDRRGQRSVYAGKQGHEPRLITVARPAVGKGLSVARNAAAQLRAVNWHMGSGTTGLHPSEVRELLAQTDLCVVPSEHGTQLPGEGRPHIIHQALVSGIPIVGGPNLAVRDALRTYGQLEVSKPGPTALADAIRHALKPSVYTRLRSASLRAGTSLRWESVIPGWNEALATASIARGLR